MFSFSFVSFFHLFENKYPPPSRTFNLSTQLYTRDKRLTISHSHDPAIISCSLRVGRSKNWNPGRKRFFFFFLPRCVTTSKLSVSRSCDVANRRCSNSTIQWLWVSNSVSGRGRGVSILVFHEPKFAVIEISWPGNRRTQCRTILKISTSRVSNYFFDYLSKISNEKIFE